MSTSKGAAEPGKKRATEVMDAMKGMTAYSTDDLFFVARYGATAKVRVMGKPPDKTGYLFVVRMK